MLLSSMPELFASWNFSPNSYFPSFISIENLQIKGGLGAYKARRLCFTQRNLDAISLYGHLAMGRRSVDYDPCCYI